MFAKPETKCVNRKFIKIKLSFTFIAGPGLQGRCSNVKVKS